MKKLGKMRLLHADGTVVSFRGARLEDDGPSINRFLYKHGALTQSVVISFDSQKNHQYWKCTCGGYNLPYSACDHLKYLEIIPNVSDGLIVLTEDEFGHFNHMLTPPNEDSDGLSAKKIGYGISKPPEVGININIVNGFAAAAKQVGDSIEDLIKKATGEMVKKISDHCVSCGKKLPLNSGWCSCGVVNAEYEGMLQETNSSIGIAGQSPVPVKYTFTCPDCHKKFQSEDSFAACPSCPMAETQFPNIDAESFICGLCGLSFMGFSNSVHINGQAVKSCSDCAHKEFNKHLKKKKFKVGGSKIPEPWELACDQFTVDPKSNFCIHCGYRKSDHEMKKAMTPGFVGKAKTTIQFKDGSVMDMDSSKVKFTFRDVEEGRFPEPVKSKDIPETKGKRVFADKDEEV